MIQGFYSAMIGAQQQMLRMDVQANNISNVNTNGFKAQVPAFQSLMYGMMQGIDGEQLPRGSGTYLSATGSDTSVGAYRQTGLSQDYAIIGEGYFALYDPVSGEVSYTRDGAFTVAQFQDAAGNMRYYLSDGEGRQVLDANRAAIPVTDPQAKLPVGVFAFQYEDGLLRIDSSRFAASDKNGAVTVVQDAQVAQGMLEESNTDLATALTQVIEAQRSYSYALKMVQTADEVESTINGLTNG